MVGRPPLKLLARSLQLQDDISTLIKANQMECVLADIDADGCDRGRHWLT
jgi:hypothetical protein